MLRPKWWRVMSFSPLLYLSNFEGPISGYFRYCFYINSVANFFIYLVVDEEFRAKLKAIRKH